MRGITKPCTRALVVTLPGLWCLWACTGDPFVTFYQELEHDAGRADNGTMEHDVLVTDTTGTDTGGKIPSDGMADSAESLDGNMVDTSDAGLADNSNQACTIGTVVNQCGPSCPDGYSAVEYCWGTCGCGQEAMLKCVCVKG